MVNLKVINEDNFLDAFQLKLADGQEKYVSNPIRSLAQAYVYRKQCQPFGIYDGERIIGGLGVIENDFHDRKDLAPNVCAVYTEEAYRGKGIAGKLLNMAVEDMREKGVSPLYLITDHTCFYERYGWEFLCMVQGDGEEEVTRMYIHR